MHILAYIAATIFAIASLATNDMYYLMLGMIAIIIGIATGKD
jgi:membrane protein implicated in regulation of membrane protease activity